ncbi:LOW QUALITY PROTEIN: hydroxyproline O-galactosyltransferase GALT3-like [Salvia miltiorrhiza]|uniref:LOW QUALITY PROTEIN: hydroxyproline O-galactosyltransferase GALT3-like n=1 Tax=Salvia miltiorrhiza TaxID=226208 RepID=UPI0025AC0049|nr:LOW QUALITY PROTEIN: hydroxyproline O-galactosyltransferase GALT3-like [Salvia miltiorrhiza]
MKKWTGGVLIVALALILFLSYTLIGKSESSKKQSAYDFFNPQPPKEEDPDLNANADANANGGSESSETLHTITRPKPQLRYLQELEDLYSLSKNLSREDPSALLAWGQMKFLFPRSDALPETDQGIKEALVMCRDLLVMVEEDKAAKLGNASMARSCPSFVSATLSKNESLLEIPCGLVEDSSVTVIGIPDTRQDSFQIELIGSPIEEGLKPPILLHYNVVLPGENLTKEPVLVQNSWIQESGWGKPERCPDHAPPRPLQVDGLVKCNTQIIRKTADESANTTHPTNRKLANVSEGSTHVSSAFQFVEGNPFIATFWAGVEGFHTTVNGRHETSFAYRERLEPWLVNRVDVKGSLTTISIIAKGLPASEDVDLVGDAQQLKAAPLSDKRPLLLLIGVFSSGNNFERRMALRRTWMQYDGVRSGKVAVRFFIGLHKNKEVNLKVWREGEVYGDIQLMPFVDYYSLLTYKTIAICILGSEIVSARFIMKMDDDAFVRIDEVVSRLEGRTGKGFVYGRISFDSAPNRDKDNKWFISEEEWRHSSYPPWAHGPGYIVSHDVAKFIVAGHRDRDLMLFKLEDVAVGIWIQQYESKGQKIEYVNDDRFNNEGCESDYILAHYQNPRMMLCLWDNLLKLHKPQCCE